VLGLATRKNRIGAEDLRPAVSEFEALHDQLDIVEVTEALVRELGNWRSS